MQLDLKYLFWKLRYRQKRHLHPPPAPPLPPPPLKWYANCVSNATFLIHVYSVYARVKLTSFRFHLVHVIKPMCPETKLAAN